MATRTSNSVTLTHEDAVRISCFLGEYSGSQFTHARRTKNAAVKYQCEKDGNAARLLSDDIIRNLWTWK